MENQIVTLPDGSEIRIENTEKESWWEWEEGAMWTTTDRQLIEAMEDAARPGETSEALLKRLVNERLEEIRNRPEWERDPDEWKRNAQGEG